MGNWHCVKRTCGVAPPQLVTSVGILALHAPIDEIDRAWSMEGLGSPPNEVNREISLYLYVR